MLFHGDGNEHEGDLLFERALIIEEFYDVMPLHGFDGHAERAGNVDALLDDALCDAAGIFPRRDFAERAARDGGKPRKRAVDEQFRPPRADEILFDDDRPHTFEELFRLFQTVAAAVRTQRERERGRLGREFGDALAVEGRAPRDGAAERSVRADNFGNGRLGQTVLTGAERAVRSEVVFQKRDHFGIVLLFGHEQDNVVLALHLFGIERVHLLRELRRSDNLRAVFAQRLDVRPVAVEQIDLDARSRDICAEHRTQRARAVNSVSHLLIPQYIFSAIPRGRCAPK